jgi:hypothetical protein
MENNIMVYFHVNPIKQEVFYVGMGGPHRPHDPGKRNNWWEKIVNKYGYDVIIIHENLSWDEACKLEMKYIKQIGRRDLGLGPLVNMTDGGDGAFGQLCSEETKTKLSNKTKNKVAVKDKNGNKYLVSKDDPRYLSGELVGIAKGRIVVVDKTGHKFMIDKNDPRLSTGELVAYNKGIPKTKESNEKRSKTQKGRIAWNKGKRFNKETQTWC